MRGRAVSPRGDVTVVVDASGRLVDLALSERAGELRPADLARSIVDTANKARVRAGEQAVAVAVEAFGEDSGVVARLRSEVDEHAPEPGSQVSW
ncbi:YbaB/EbfC family nucleoid-associated protein [Microbacterium sp.]|uniref:YbaB/EbfC family nucleoid-associated protein n=1 Tax=Microbacterium sp. TaxID=51671 RepID=UPI0039E4BA00